MGDVIHGSICPHPPIIIPEIGKDELSRVRGTVKSLRETAKSLNRLKPEVLVIVTPHAPAFEESIAVNQVPILRGDFGQFGAPEVSFEVENDLEFGNIILEQARAENIPVDTIDANFLRENRITKILDHGAMVPLYFFREAGVKCPVVLISISFLPLERIYLFGTAIQAAANKYDKNVAVLASGDLSHRLTPGAPAGYDSGGKVFDEKVQQAVRKVDPMELLNLSDELVERAGQCGLRPLLMLMGVFEKRNVRSNMRSYEGPFGVGYLVAEFIPKKERGIRKGILEKLFGTNNTTGENENGGSYPVKLARESLEKYLSKNEIVPVPRDIPSELAKPAGVFVSLKKQGELRGCIGTMAPTRENAAEEIIVNAISAATKDPRFTPVSLDELKGIDISVDILGEAEPIENINELDPKRYGVIVRRGDKTGVLLPDIEGVDTVQEQLRIAKLKAGISEFEDCEIERFNVTRYT